MYENRRVCLFYCINGSAKKPSGTAVKMGEKYPWSDCFKNRVQLYDLNRATRSSRQKPGTLVFHDPPADQEKEFPHIAIGVNQYGPGPEVEINRITQEVITSSVDCHHVENLKNDTLLQRKIDFESLVNQLRHEIMKRIMIIDVLVIPAGVGTGDYLNKKWRENYLPILKNLAKHLCPLGVRVILLENPNDPDTLFERDDVTRDPEATAAAAAVASGGEAAAVPVSERRWGGGGG